ncbi:MAG TPA: dephospho-CoA kinase [Acidobacteriota bacterium]|nr:dephospho-CoA kinase [Acidobacteriota bacterium]
MLKVGLTGGIACGKSKALLCFEQLGAFTVDADKIAREVVQPGQPAYQKILDEFGPDMVGTDGELDRAKLGDLVFSDDSARSTINSIVHPFVLAEEDRLVRELENNPHQYPMVVTDAALMVEVGSYTKYDIVIVAYCPPSMQLERLMKRNALSKAEALRRVSSQMPLLEKIEYADYIIDTSRDQSETQEQIRHIYAELLER